MAYLDYEGLAYFYEKLKSENNSLYETQEAASAFYTEITNTVNGKQDALTAGTGIDITNNVISCTLDTTVFKIVESLPTSNIDTNVIYVVTGTTTGSGDNLFSEYIYVNGNWEKLGEFKADTDLSDYYTKSQVDELIATAQLAIDNQEAEIQEIFNTMLTKSEAASTYATIADTYTKEEVDNLIDNVTVDLSDYYTKEQCDDKFALKSDVQALESTVSEIESSVEDLTGQVEELTEQVNDNTSNIEDLATRLQALVGDSVSWISTDEYLLAAVDCEDTLLFAITVDGKLKIPYGLPDGIIDGEQSLADLLGGYVLTDYLTENYYTQADVDQKIADAVMGGQVDLSGYLKKTEAEELYQPIGDYALKSDIPTVPTNVSAFTNDAGYITSSDIPTNISSFTNDAGYVTQSYADGAYVLVSDSITNNQIDSLFD